MDSIDPNDIDSSIDRQQGESDANNRIDQQSWTRFMQNLVGYMVILRYTSMASSSLKKSKQIISMGK